MTVLSRKFPGLTANTLKLIALVTMTCDHVGVALLPQVLLLRIIGRLSLPVFAFMIAQGCRYTRSRSRYFLGIALLALLCQAVYFTAMRSLYQCILVTFSLSIAMICLLDWSVKQPPVICALTLAAGVASVYFLTDLLPQLLPGTDYRIDYGFCGVLLPVLVYMGRGKWGQLAMAAGGLVLLALQQGGIQWLSLLALPVLALYNGKRGTARCKYLFYIYYPAHLVVIQLLDILL